VRGIAETRAGLREGSPQTTVDGGSCVPKYVRLIKENPLYAVAALLIVLVVVFVAVGTGRKEGGTESETTPSAAVQKKKAKPKLPKGRKVREAPIGTSGVIDQARREGDFVVAQARGTIRNPSSVRLRVSASPRQRVTVDWQLSCFRDRRVKVGRGRYRTRAPSTRSIAVPMPGAQTCIATAGAQLTRYGRGIVKVAVVAG
jgi:hypothetical protein